MPWDNSYSLFFPTLRNIYERNKMSTGLDCYFEEKEPNEWYMYLEEDYGSKIDIEYDQYGPFRTFAEAQKYLQNNFANPGGYGIDPHPDSTDKTWEFD